MPLALYPSSSTKHMRYGLYVLVELECGVTEPVLYNSEQKRLTSPIPKQDNNIISMTEGV